MRILSLLLIPLAAQSANVYTASGFKAKSALTGNEQILWCESGSTSGAAKESCAKQVMIPWHYAQDYSWVLTDAGWYPWREVSDVAAPLPAFTYVNPQCIPSVSEVRWRWQGSQVIALWYCDTPRFIQKVSRAFDLSKPSRPVSLQTIGGMSKDELMKADRLAVNRTTTAAEDAAIDALEAAEGIKITVASNGTTNTRPIYKATTDNLRGAVTSARATVGAPCGRLRLQNADGSGSMYFNVEGGYTLCKITGAVSK